MKYFSKNKYKKYLYFLAYILAICVLFFLFKKNIQTFKQLFSLSLVNFTLISVIYILFFLANIYFFQKLLLVFNLNLKFKENAKLILLNNISQYLIPKSGQVTRSLYLKKYYNFNHKQYLVLYFLLNLITVFSISFVGLLLNLFIWNKYLFIVLIILNLSTIFLFFFPNIFLKFLKINFLKFFKEEWSNIKKKKKELFQLFFLRLSILFLNSFNFYFIYKILFQNISYLKSILIMVAGALSPLISITPASIGINEGLSAYTAKLLGVNLLNTVSVVVFLRALSLFWVFIFLLFLAKFKLSIIFHPQHLTKKE